MGSAPEPEIETHHLQGVVVVYPRSKKIMDPPDIQNLGRHLDQLIQTEGKYQVVLDLAEVEYISSGVLGLLVAVNRTLRELGGKIRLCNVRPIILNMFEFTQFSKLLTIYDSRDRAVESFRNTGPASPST